MNDSSRTDADRGGLTLVEVVAAIVLLATLLVGMITAYGTHHRQINHAAQRQEATAVADQLLSAWYSGTQPKVPRQAQGVVRGRSDYLWQTSLVQQTTIEMLPVEIVRLQVFRARDASLRTSPLAQVDLLLDVDRPNLTGNSF